MKKAVLTIIFLLIGVVSMYAQYVPHDGDIDSTFGVNGSAIFSGNTNAKAMTVLPNDEIVVFSWFIDPANNRANGLLKLDKNGEVDTSFGTHGISTFPPSYFLSQAGHYNCITYDANGAIISVGSGYDSSVSKDTGIVITRNLPNGLPDASFNKTGLSIAVFPGIATLPIGLIVQPDGKYLVECQDTDINTKLTRRLVRFNVNGIVDSSFGTTGNGWLTLNAPGAGLYANTFTGQPDGKFLTTGQTTSSIQRFNTDGSIDSTFGLYGNAILPSTFGALALLANGKIMVGGIASASINSSDFALFRLNSTGVPDSTFGTNGATYTDIDSGSTDLTEYICIQADNKIILSGVSSIGHVFKQALVRYTEKGILDTTFGANGRVVQGTGCAQCNTYMWGTGLQSTGAIITAGQVFGPPDGIFVSRYIGHPYSSAVTNIVSVKPILSIYPNPTTGTFTLAALNLTGNASIAVCDILGKTVLTTQHNFSAAANTKIDLSALATGVYFVKVMSAAGSVQVVKLVKE